MADLENLLLEAAGRTGGSGRNRHSRPPSRRKREASYSDNGSDSNDDRSDGDQGYATRKPSVYQVPLKKRLDPSGRDDDRGNLREDASYEDDDKMGSGSDESDVGSDLYKDDYDREQLAQLTELEREMILSDRAQKRDDQRLTERVRAKQSGKKTQVVKETPDTPSSRVRSSARFAERATAKDDALNELRAKRMKQQDPEGHRKLRDGVRGHYGGRDTSPVRRKSAVAAQSSDSSQSENQSSHSRDEGSAGEDDSDEERSKKDELTLEDIQEITIRRSKLAKWFMEPFFEEVIVGCFVRVGIGKKGNKAYYRLCIVKNVDATEPNKQYRLENKSTHKYLSVTWGRSEARWQMAVISESLPLEEEFNEWVKAMKKDGVRMPSRQDILEKREAIQKAVTFVYSSETVKQMLQEKKSASSRPLNIAAEKDRLRKEKEIAESKRNKAEVERIQARLQELEAISRQVKDKDSKAVKLAEMNKKNRAENFKNASEKKPVNTSLKAGEAGYDPFSRRWTRSQNYYVSNPGGGDETAASANEDAAGSLGPGVENKEAALEAAAVAGKLVDTNAPLDQGTESNSLHNFELQISLAELQRFGGPQGAHLGFMARKQRIEATIGRKVPENDGRRHSLTLTVSDYKRRRGLL
ncbi:hypothetical protein AQUCO_01200224v1 [Aquilegia coerulea]|uniref:Plus3 domain-containing protein n=1 Tax=Aquilegia coerulea TaxID=218851 RepID=A0A2G5E4Y4_AQUCA|nr:hypothetical protein AQUCO_01200224v1 [Aquilegia coerulea]